MLFVLLSHGLTRSILDEEICLDNYVPIRLDRDRHGGGILIVCT